MASSIIHICVANEINKSLKRNSRELLIGTIAPDISKLLGESKLYSHFLDDIDNNIPNINNFLIKYKNYLDDDFVLGYYIHLYTDYLWFKYFITKIIDGNYLKELDGTNIKYNNDTFTYYVYNDYSNLNKQLLDKYNFPLKIFYEEIPMDKLYLIVNKTGILIEKATNGKRYLFEIEDIINFIDEAKEIILKELNNLYETV